MKTDNESIGETLLTALDELNDARNLSKSMIKQKIVENYDILFPLEGKLRQRDLYLKAKSEITDLKKLMREIELDSRNKYPILYETLPGNKIHYCMMKVFVRIIKLVELKFGDVWYDIITFAFDIGQIYLYANTAQFPICKYITKHGPDFEHLNKNKNPLIIERLRRF